MYDDDLVDIALATYNGERFIRQQLDSIAAQTHTRFVVHICDDGSKDRTLELLRDHELHLQHKLVIHPGEGGLGASRNFSRAISHCDAPYIALCDQDDYWHPEKLAKLLASVREAEQPAAADAVLAFSDLEIVNETLETIQPSFYRASSKSSLASRPEDFLVSNHIPGCSMLFNQRLKDLFQPIPERVRMHDWWIAMVAASSGSIRYVDQPLVKYRQHNNNTIGVPGLNGPPLPLLRVGLQFLRSLPVIRQRTATMLAALQNYYTRDSIKTEYFRAVVEKRINPLDRLRMMRNARNGERKSVSYLIWWTV